MEYQFPSFSIFSAFLVFVFMAWRIWSRSKHNNNSITHLSPPGPRKLPLIGNIHQLAGSLPYRRLRDLAQKHGPLMHLQLGEIQMFVISSAEIAKEVMRTQELMFAQRPTLLASHVLSYNFTDIIFAPYGDYWRQSRKMCTIELLSSKRVGSFQSIREEETTKLVTSLSSAGTVINLSRMLYSLTYSITSRSAISTVSSTSEAAFISMVKKLIRLTSAFNIEDLYPSVKLLHVITGMRQKLKRLHQKFDKIMESIIKEHKDRRAARSKASVKHEDKDLVDILLSLQEQGNLEVPFTTDNIKAIIQDLLIAGTDSSSTTLEWAMSELMRNPRIMEKTQADVRRVFGRIGRIDEADFHQLQYLKLVIKETLRLHPPVTILVRESRRDCKINGYNIPAKSQVAVNVWAIARDPKYWNEAERFYPERFLDSEIDYKGTNFEFLPFGAGRRMCPGILFAMANVELQLANLLYHFNWELPAGKRPEDLDMTENFGAVTNRKNALLLVPTPYQITPPVN